MAVVMGTTIYVEQNEQISKLFKQTPHFGSPKMDCICIKQIISRGFAVG